EHQAQEGVPAVSEIAPHKARQIAVQSGDRAISVQPGSATGVNKKTRWILLAIAAFLLIGIAALIQVQGQVRILSGHEGEVLSLAFSPDGQILASGSNDNSVRLWSVRDGTLLRSLTG